MKTAACRWLIGSLLSPAACETPTRRATDETADYQHRQAAFITGSREGNLHPTGGMSLTLPSSLTWRDLAVKTHHEIVDDDVLGMAAQLSLYFFLR